MMAQMRQKLRVTISKQVDLEYLLYLPEGYDEALDRTWPLVLYLHGAGERGSDLSLVKTHGIPKLAERGADLPFIAISPQCPTDTWWSSHIDALDALLKAACASHAVDEKRVYLTGLSTGGFGTWHLATLWPDRFAAIAPICGGGPWPFGFPEKVRVIKHVPTWVFHGAKDTTVPLGESERLVEELRAAGGEVRFTVYPEAAHDSWTETYDNPNLYSWLLSQRRP